MLLLLFPSSQSCNKFSNLCSSFKSAVADTIHPPWLYEIQASISSTAVRQGPSATIASWGSLPQSLHKQLATWLLAFFHANRSTSLSWHYSLRLLLSSNSLKIVSPASHNIYWLCMACKQKMTYLVALKTHYYYVKFHKTMHHEYSLFLNKTLPQRP